MSDFESLVPLDGVRRFLDTHIGASDASIDVRRLGDGHSNLTFIVSRGADEWVLRRPPRGDILPGTHEMHREYQVMNALAEAGSPVPVPKPVVLCEQTAFIGSPFYLMEYVDGIVVRGPIPDPFDVPERRREMGFELTDKLADIHGVDWQAIGLADMARKPEQFLQRNLRRMQELYDAIKHRDVAEVDEAGEWLRAHAPEQADVTLTHGDYKLDNVMFAPDAPPRIAAIVDWEISTIGDPMVDLGWMLYFSPDGSDTSAVSTITDGPGAGGPGPTDGYPSRAELADRYAERTGRSLGDLRFYTAMAGWKIAIIMEGSNFRFKQGMADDSMFAALDAAVPALAGRALSIIRGEIPVGA